MTIWFWAYSAILGRHYPKASQPFTTTHDARQWCKDAIRAGVRLCH